ncbi:hypothetical protein TI39_contig4116g00004 [Zymoseptoria brevis]|uniref:AAA+ ATPase domain-containing protein n=1 Tax=Zymoseptoria brevis TaxID=1047168 RepID=A0A0F4GGP3_9PEZI|nr:hypothetical protein TI39_contig4116g00004 [Zymoseptoria brevis]
MTMMSYNNGAWCLDGGASLRRMKDSNDNTCHLSPEPFITKNLFFGNDKPQHRQSTKTNSPPSNPSLNTNTAHLNTSPPTMTSAMTPNNEDHHLFDDLLDLTSARTADHDLHYLTSLRFAHPTLIITAIPTSNIPLLAFASSGHATATLDKETDSFASWRGYVGPSANARDGALAESVHFGKYGYVWKGERFTVWVVGGVQYVGKERGQAEHPLGPSGGTDALIQAVGGWLLDDVVWVYDGYWYQDKKLYAEVSKMDWSKVILDEGMKREIQQAADKFFDSKDAYDDLGVPWKRGLLFHGPPGNGKTISIKALMHGLLSRTPHHIPTLYVKTAPREYNIKDVFDQARRLAPCMLVLEDVETIVTPSTRSYFFNQMDGLEDNSGLFVVASTNYLDRLDPGLTSRPSRFDRKYLFPLPSEHERRLYCEFWRGKVVGKGEVEFPGKLCPAMARITEGFSFAFLQECFVASLLSLIHQESNGDKKKDELEKYELWVAFRKQAGILKKEIRNEEITGREGSEEFDATFGGPKLPAGPDALPIMTAPMAPQPMQPSAVPAWPQWCGPNAKPRLALPTPKASAGQEAMGLPGPVVGIAGGQTLPFGEQLGAVNGQLQQFRVVDEGTARLPVGKSNYINSAAWEQR